MTAVMALTRRSVLHSVRDIETMLMAVLLPVFLLLVFTYVFGGAIAGSTADYLDYVVPGVIVVCASFGASHTAISVARDMNEGMMDRFRTMDMPRSAAIVGHVVASVARNLLATIVVLAVATALGFRGAASPAQWVAVLAMVTLYLTAITMVFAAIGIVAKSAEAASGYGFVLLFLPYLSSAFAPVETMPGWLQAFAGNQPLSPISDTLRELMHGAWPGSTGLVAVTWCVGLTILGLVAGAWLFARRSARR